MAPADCLVHRPAVEAVASVIPKIGAAIGVGTHYVYTPYYKGAAPQNPTTQPQSADSSKPAPTPDLAPLRVTVTR